MSGPNTPDEQVHRGQTHRERPEDLTLLGWLATLSHALWISLGFLRKVMKALLVPSRRQGLSLHEYAAFLGMRVYQGQLSAVRIQNLLPPTATSCRRFARRHRLHHGVVELPHGAVLHRLGSAAAAQAEQTRHVVLLHGGGYMAPLLGRHLEFAFGFAERPADGVVVHVLQYALVSGNANRYPCQLRQAAALLHHLLHVDGVPASRILLLGDSAGAHLLLGLALHLAHPNPLVAPLPPLQGRLAGAVLLSPWLSLHRRRPGREAHAAEEPTPQDDVLDDASLARWAAAFLGDAAADPWNDPLTAPPEWWDDLPVGDLLLLYGAGELLRDDAARLAEVLGKSSRNPASTVVAAVPDEVHVHMVMNRFLRLNRPCESEHVFRLWMEAHLKG